MAFFGERIVLRVTKEQKKQIKDLLARKGVITSEDSWEYKYENVSHLIRCVINVLWKKDMEEEIAKTKTKKIRRT